MTITSTIADGLRRSGLARNPVAARADYHDKLATISATNSSILLNTVNGPDLQRVPHLADGW